ncbi:MAG: 4a-hydroxytetrahydrobiopterin dehydratase [Candidatus Dormibacteria bacterium]
MPNQTSRSLLDSTEAAARLATLAGWHIDGSELVKSYKFKNFVQAVAFVNAITTVAEAQNHHPDLLVRWGEVTVRVSTHSAGGLTAKDFELAAAIDRA